MWDPIRSILAPGLACLSAILALALPRPVRCQAARLPLGDDIDSRYTLDSWSIREGLPQNSISAILQTRDGYLWIATFGGLMRFDGMEFTVFEMATAEGLASNRILALYEDREGRLWIGHEQTGITVFEDGAFTTVSMPLVNGHVWAFAEDPEGALWVATEDGLFRWKDGGFTTYTTRDGLPSNHLSSLLVDGGGNLWIGTNRGAARFANGTFTLYDTARGLPSDAVRALYEDPSGALWIGTGLGLAVFRGDRFEPIDLEGGTSLAVRCLAEDPQGDFWIGADDGLVLLANPRAAPDAGRRRIVRPFASHFAGTMRSVAIDREGNVWVGTNTSGLSRLRLRHVRHFVPAESGPDQSIAAITADGEGGLWIGATNGPLYRWRDGRLAPYDLAGRGVDSLEVQSLLHSPSGALWIGGIGELTRLRDGAATRWTTADGLPASRIRALFEDRSGRLWLGTEGDGLLRMDEHGFTRYTTGEGLLHDDVAVITQDRRGALWIGSRRGLSRFQQGRFTHYTAADGLSRGTVRAIYEDGSGTLWIGTYGGGLSRFKDGRFTRFTRADGLYDNAVSRILEDEHGQLWMLGNLGIFAVERQSLNDFAEGRMRSLHCVTFGAAEGMFEGNGQSQPAGWRTADGKMWFPTIRGVAVIDAKHFHRNRIPPPVVIEKVMIDGLELDGRDAVAAPPGDGDLEIHYAGLSFVAPEKVRFQYRLDGRDRDWVDAGTRRIALYTNIPPGSYTFRVIAANNDGVWNESGATLAITLAPFFYETAWFRGLLAVAVALAAFTTFHVRVRNVTERNRRLQAEILERQRAQKEKESLIAVLKAKNEELERFSYTVSHDLKSPLVTIKGFLGHLERDLADGRTERIGSNVDFIARAADQMSHLLEDLLELSRIGRVVNPSEDVELAEVAREVLATLAGRIRQTGVEVEVEEGMPAVKADRMRVREVLQNLVDNGVKFMGAQEKPRLAIGARRENGEVVCFVRDNGSGIPPDFHEKVFGLFHQLDPGHEGTGIGLALVRRIVEFHGGRVWVESQGRGQGTTFYFTLPPASESLDPR